MRISSVPGTCSINRPAASTFIALLALICVTLNPGFSVRAQEKAISTQRPAGSAFPLYDFTGDQRTDFTTLSFGAGNKGDPITWKVLRNPADPAPNAAFIRVFDYGIVPDIITSGDFIGDGKTDLGVWRAGYNFVSPFPESTGLQVSVVNWGTSTDILGGEGRYDGDAKYDLAVLRVSDSQINWFIHGSTGTDSVVPFGSTQAGVTVYLFQGADFTGDGRDELVICKVSNSTGATNWLVGDSVTGAVILNTRWGNFFDDFLINPADYNGDGLADLVVWRSGGLGADARTWYIRNTANGNPLPATVFGVGDPVFVDNDLPLRGDYDGDFIADIAVFRPSTREWFWLNSSNGALGYQQWGVEGDRPLPNFFTY